MHTSIRIAIVSAFCAAALLAGGCSAFHSKVATVDIMTIQANWPKFQNYANQLQASFAAINASKMPQAEKVQQLARLQDQSRRWQDEVTGELRGTVTTIALQRHYQLVVTREGVAYGGDDITTSVEQAMGISTASPSPGS